MTISIKPTASGSTIEQDGSTILTVDGSGNITAANNFSATGHVLQVVSETFNTQTASTASSYVATHITANITPSSTSSKILIIVNSCYGLDTPFSNFRFAGIYRNSTGVGNILTTRAGFFSSNLDLVHFTMQYLDSPATTSTINYNLKIRPDGSGCSIGGRYANTSADQQSTITLIEVAG